MTTLPTPTDYTDKDFASLNKRLETLLQQVFPAWTDFTRASFGNILKEMFAFAMDVVCFYQDGQALETRWGTAMQRSSIIELAKLIGYELDGASASTGSVIFTLSRVMPGDVTIPAGTVVKTKGQNAVPFQTLAAVTITSGSTTSASVSIEQSESQTDPFEAVGEASEEFQLTQTPFLDDSLVLTIGGTPWTKVDNFLQSTATDTHYIVLVDEEDKARARVGDGRSGSIPAPGAIVSAAYKTGGGRQGNVEANTIVVVEGSFVDSLGNTASLVCDNAAALTDGLPRETVAEARYNAPASLRVLNRTIARTDWEDLAIQVSGIARALMLTKDEDTTIPEDDYGYLYLVADGGGAPSAAKKAEVETYINDNFPIPLNFSWEAADGVFKTIDIVAYVYPNPGYTESQIETQVLAALREYFAPSNDDGTPNLDIDFGYNYKDSSRDPDPLVSLSHIGNLIEKGTEDNPVTSIRRLGTPNDSEGLTLNTVEDDVTLTLREFPQGGNLTLYNGDTSLAFSGHPIAI